MPLFSGGRVLPTDAFGDKTDASAFDNGVCALTVIRMVDELVHETHGHAVSSRHGEEKESGAAGIRCEGWRLGSGW